MSDKQTLTEKVNKVFESTEFGAKPIEEKFRKVFSKIILEQMKHVVQEDSSGTYSGDIAALGSVLVPAYRRAFGQMIGKYLAGIQPMTQATGYAYAMRYHFSGNSASNGADLVKGGGNTGFQPLDYNWTPQDTQRSAVNSIILIWDSVASRQADAPDVGYGEAHKDGISDLSGLATVIYSEDNKAVLRTAGATTIDTLKALVSASGNGIIEWYDNEAGYLNILKNYVGPLSTLTAEKLGNNTDEYALTVDKIGIEAKERRAAARITLASIEDLKSAHGRDLDSEMVDILYYEMAQSVDRDIIDSINAIAVTTNYNAASIANGGQSDGRWELERFRSMWTQIIRRASDIARTTLRGPGNNLVATPDVVTAISQLSGFTGVAPVSGSVNPLKPVDASQSSFNGVMDGRINVFSDVFTRSGNYATILYKGANNYDAPVIYSPYIAAEVRRTTDQESANARIIVRERSAISNNIFASDSFVRKMNITNLF